MTRSLLSLCALLVCISTSFAHPVSFTDGKVLQAWIQPKRADIKLNYTLKNNLAVGVSATSIERQKKRYNFTYAQGNVLLKRWNMEQAQANLYTSLGVGGRSGDAGPSIVGYAGVQADYETRRVYTLFAADTLRSKDLAGFTRFKYRFGLSPYLAGYDLVQTWLVTQVDHMPTMDDAWMITPLIRLFYKNYLFEAGSSTEGQVFIQGMIHF